ncbi:MAG: BtrH N-terminal domain-containing protein [Eubacteriales bacterium]|nr:BtrH N-terminal domain-containing protein [Eubacteriales bacterium]
MQKKVENFMPQGGRHCITNSLKQIFTYYGYPLSEEMLFGLASGLSFLYLNQSAAPMVNGRIKVFEFEKKLASRLNIGIKCKSGSDYTKIFQSAKNMIDKNMPVLVYADMPYLQYLGMDKNSHFGGHAVVLFGYDDDAQQFLVSDRDNHDHPIKTPYGNIAEDYHLAGYKEIEKARSSSFKPFPAKNKYLLFDFNGYRRIDKTVLEEAIQETCQTMLNPPAKLLGVNGILKFSKEILKWKKFDPDKLKLSAITNYFQISEDGGTGGGIFRNMYGGFLIEAAPIMNNESIARTGRQFLDIGKQWDKIAEYLWQLSLDGDISLLHIMSEIIEDIYQQEIKLYESLRLLTIQSPDAMLLFTP